MIKNISNLGDAALYCDFGNEVNKSINSQVIKYFKTIKEKKFEGILFARRCWPKHIGQVGKTP